MYTNNSVYKVLENIIRYARFSKNKKYIQIYLYSIASTKIGSLKYYRHLTKTASTVHSLFKLFQTLIFSTNLRESEMEIYRDRGISVAHCPFPDLK